MALRVILLGPPGAGKGTQAKNLADEFGMAHVASGDLFRANLQQKTPLGLKAKAYMDKGELVPDDVTVEMVLDRLRALGAEAGVLLDGFPRTRPQAVALDEALARNRDRVTGAVLLDVPEGELLTRLAGRRTCKLCQTAYHVTFSPPKREGVCDACGGELVQRDDEKPEVVANRLKVYRDQTAPLIEYYGKQGKLERVDGMGAMDIVTRRLTAVIRRWRDAQGKR